MSKGMQEAQRQSFQQKFRTFRLARWSNWLGRSWWRKRALALKSSKWKLKLMILRMFLGICASQCGIVVHWYWTAWSWRSIKKLVSSVLQEHTAFQSKLCQAMFFRILTGYTLSKSQCMFEPSQCTVAFGVGLVGWVGQLGWIFLGHLLDVAMRIDSRVVLWFKNKFWYKDGQVF